MKNTLVFFACLLSIVFAAEKDLYDDDSMPKPESLDEPEPDHQICAENEVWMVCSSCEQQCGRSLSSPPKPCPKVCQPARCQCPAHKGYRRDADGKCVFCHNNVL